MATAGSNDESSVEKNLDESNSTVAMENDEETRATDTTVSERLNASAKRMAKNARKRALNTSIFGRAQTLKANNTALARSLSLAKEEIKLWRNKVTEMKAENQELRTQLATFNNNTLYEEAIRQEVKTRVLDIMSEVEEEFGEAKTQYIQCQELMTRVHHDFEQMTEFFHQGSRPMDRLSKVIQKYTDEAGEFLIETPADVMETRKTLATLRKTLHFGGHGEPQVAREAGTRRKTEDSGEDAPPPRVRRSVGPDTNHGTSVSAGDALQELEQEAANATRRKTIAKPTLETMEEQQNEDTPTEELPVLQQNVTQPQNSPVLNGPAERTPEQRKELDVPKKKTRTVADRRKTKAVVSFKNAEDGSDADDNKANASNKRRQNRHTVFVSHSEPGLIKKKDEEKQSTPPRDSGDASAEEQVSEDAEKTPEEPKIKKTATSRLQRATASVETDRIKSNENRPKRHTAVSSYKEPALNRKLRRGK